MLRACAFLYPRSNSRFLRYLLQLLVSLYHMATSNPVANNTLVDQYWLQAKLLWSSYRTAHTLLAAMRAESCLSQASHYRVLKVHDTSSLLICKMVNTRCVYDSVGMTIDIKTGRTWKQYCLLVFQRGMLILKNEGSGSMHSTEGWTERGRWDEVWVGL